MRTAKDAYEIIAGERRWRAAQRAGLHEIPIVPLEATDAEALELAIIENVQRTDLNALEEAGGYQRLASEYGHSHEAIAHMVGKSRSHVSNTMRLLKLPETVKAYISAGKISAGAARMLVGCVRSRKAWRGEIVERGLNVRQVEALAKERARKPVKVRQRAEQTKAPTPLRSSGGFPMRWAHRHSCRARQERRAAHPLPQSRSARGRGAPAGEELGFGLCLRVDGEREQRPVRNYSGHVGLAPRLERGVRKLRHRAQQSRAMSTS